MKLSKLLLAIDKVATVKGLSKPYIVGGLTRDKLLGRIEQINDVDITTGDSGIHFLAREVAKRLSSYPNFNYEEMTNGYSKINIGRFKIDFSSNFKVPGIDAILREIGIDEPTEMQKELYSRDFTCNAALMSLDFKKIIDPTGLAIQDIRDRMVRTLLPPKLTLGYDNNRIVRVIYLAAKLGFGVDPTIKEWIESHAKLIANAKPDYISQKLKKAAEFNPEIAGNLLTELGLWKYVPLIPELIEYQKEGLVIGASKQSKTKTKTKKKDKKRVDLDTRPYPNPFFTNYDYGGPEDGTDVSPGTGLYHGWMGKYKSTKEFIDRSRRRRHRRKAFLDIISKIAVVIDLSERLKEKKRQEEQKGVAEQFSTAPKAEVVVPEQSDMLSRRREQGILEQTREQFGSWQHRFSDVRRDNGGFYIFVSDNPAGNKMQVGDTLADSALNMTPYWKVTHVFGNRISLEPIGTNPFLTGVGAGGARLTESDVQVFTGEYEKRRMEMIQDQMKSGDASIDDVKYLLDGTVPVNMGPNGSQGGWYAPFDTGSNRGGRKGMRETQIMVSDANKLKSWGFAVPKTALDGTMDIRDWGSWIEGNGSSDIDYIPKDLEKYIEFHRQMTQRGKWKYDDDDLDRLKRQLSEDNLRSYWEAVAMDVINLSNKEFELKYKYYDKSLKYIAEALDSDLRKLREKKKKLTQYFVEGEEENEESVLKAIFNPERRVAVRNVIRLIEMSKEDPKYLKYLRDYARLGGADWYANERVINYFDLIDDIEGLKLSAENFNDPDNIRYALGYLFDKGEDAYVKKQLNSVNDFQAINSILSRVMKQESAGYYPRKKIEWILDYADRNNLFNEIEAAIHSKTKNSYFADELLATIIRAFGIPDFFEEGDREKQRAWIELRDRFEKGRK